MTSTPVERVVLRRVYAAPAEKVFAAWTDPAQFALWYMPVDGWVANVYELDVRVAGAIT